MRSRRLQLQLTLLLSATASIAVLGQSAVPANAADSPAIIQPEALTWAPFTALPPGTQIAVLQGDPSKAGPFVVRLKLPAGYEIMTPSHPTDEVVTVVSGKLRMAFGDKADASGAQGLAPGSFMILPAGAYHRLWSDAESVVEIHSTGPFGINMAH
jgi:quercetin dioxygenase-like cupin family protein